MQPGISRAIPMGILGFMVGALIVIVLRGLQSLDPIWDPGTGIIVSVLTTAGFFVWGIGAFDPRLSVHGDETVEEAVHEELAVEAEKPGSILASHTWQITTLLLLLLIVIAGFALLPGGLALTQTIVPGASPATVGYADVPLPFGGPTIQVSTLVIFAVFIIWALVSLVAAAAALAFVFTYVSRGLAEIKLADGGTAALPAPASEKPARDDRKLFISIVQLVVVWVVLYVVLFFLIDRIMPDRNIPVLSWFFDSSGQLIVSAIVIALVGALVILRPPLAALGVIFTAIILYYFFYFVAIGLIFPEPQFPGLSIIFPNPQGQLVFLSLVNAIIFTLIILRPMLVLQTLGRVAKWLASVLRRVPNFLQ